MALNSTHPDYAANLPNWELMNDAYEGEAHVKSKTFKYLPATQSMHLDGLKLPDDIGSKSYAAYLTRAVFPDYVSDAVEMYIGLLHSKPPTIELPAQMEPLRERATSEGESLEALLRRINEHQLVRGRLGLLLDLPLNPDPTQPLPYIALYAGDAPINWDTSNDGIDAVRPDLPIREQQLALHGVRIIGTEMGAHAGQGEVQMRLRLRQPSGLGQHAREVVARAQYRRTVLGQRLAPGCE